jgi:hypothetical protein
MKRVALMRPPVEHVIVQYALFLTGYFGFKKQGHDASCPYNRTNLRGNDIPSNKKREEFTPPLLLD